MKLINILERIDNMKVFNDIDLIAMAIQLRELSSVDQAYFSNHCLTVRYHRYENMVDLLTGAGLSKEHGILTLKKNGCIKYKNGVEPVHDLRHALKLLISRRLSGLTFGQALEYLKKGYKVARKNWGGYWWIDQFFFSPRVTKSSAMIIAKCKDGSYAPAQAYQRDMLANDWKVIGKVNDK